MQNKEKTIKLLSEYVNTLSELKEHYVAISNAISKATFIQERINEIPEEEIMIIRDDEDVVEKQTQIKALETMIRRIKS